ncbi:MAG: phosphomannomutase/phosphoglucomutase [Candidatus Buchananbacteria bacterium]
MPKINPKIFKAYDVRGRYPQELTTNDAFWLGWSLVKYLKAKTIALGYDARLSSPALAWAAAQGVLAAGSKITNIGLVSTDQLYFVVGKFNYAGGIMITASHNPPQYNGLKFCQKQAIPLSYQSGLKEMATLITNAKDFKTTDQKINQKNYQTAFTKYLLSFIKAKKLKKLKIVVDASNGSVGPILKLLKTRLPVTLIPLNWQPDGNFPGHLPNPALPQNLKQLKQAVKKNHADFGVAFDGDADRLVLVDEQGQTLSGSETMLLIVTQLLNKSAKQTILYNANTSWAVPELITKLGGKAIRTPVGHSLIKPLMRKHRAVFGGESSGHFYWQTNYYADSGLITFLMVLELLSQQNQKLFHLVKKLNPYYQSPEITLPAKNQTVIIKLLAQKYSTGKTDWLDGLTVQYPDWWFNVRPSNTEPLLRINLEANSQKLLNLKRKELLQLIRRLKK